MLINPLSTPISVPDISASLDPKGILTSGTLHPELVTRVTALLQEAEKAGLRVMIFEGFRSVKRQNQLYQSGRGVTQAKGGRSYHNHGLAVDIVFYDKKGRPSWDASHNWNKLGEIGERQGLAWGGRFQRLKDLAHFEYHPANGRR